MRKFSLGTALAIIVAFLSAALAPTAAHASSGGSSDHHDYGYIRICKDVGDYHGDSYKFKFRISSGDRYANFWVKGGYCVKGEVYYGEYKIYEYPTDYWKLYDIKGDYDDEDVSSGWATVHVDHSNTYNLTFYNEYEEHDNNR
jgi:hypothetical protein